MIELKQMAPGGKGPAGLTLHSAGFLALGADDFSGEFFGEGIRVCLAGDIRINGNPLISADGLSKQTVIQAIARHYETKGDDFLRELRGSFRLALWDSHKQKLIVAADPFGTRPVYYSCSKGALVFGPRLACFSTQPKIAKEIDPNVLYFYLNHSFVPAPFTIYRDVRRLEPGQYLCWQDGRLSVRQYWDIEYNEDFRMNADVASELIRSAVEASVRQCLEAQTSSVQEIGAFLSGGTDSSTLVGLMTKITGDRIKTFSVGFAEERYNEIEYARVAAARFNAEAHECFVNADDALGVLPILAECFDEPFGNSSAIPTYFCLRMARDAGVKVMIAGDGGDELFAGNERYVGEKYFCLYDSLPPVLQVWSDRLTALLPGVNPWRKFRRYVERAREPNPGRFFHYQLFLREQFDRFFSDEFMGLLDRDFPLELPRRRYETVGMASPLNRLLYMDLKMCIADNDLFKVNRMAEALSMKVNYPYLDRDLAELTGKIPARLKLKGLKKRYIFKRAFEKLLPQEILGKKKHGFGLPVARWLRTHAGFRKEARSLLLDASVLERGYFRPNAMGDLLRRHDEETSDFYGSFIWNFMMLELWHRSHKDKLDENTAGKNLAVLG
jgi:asparagine synthase (glutamine-hydrolysing)